MAEEIDVEKSYPAKAVAAKLRRLAEALENGTNFEIMIAGNRITVPPDAMIEFEYESTEDGEQIEIELEWKKK